MKFEHSFKLLTAAATGLFLAAGSAHALPVEIMLDETAGPSAPVTPQTFGPGAGSETVSQSFGDFSLTQVIATGTPFVPQPTIIGSTTDVSATCGDCTLKVFITETFLTIPAGPGASFMINDDWLSEVGDVTNVTFKSWIDDSNTAFGTGEQLGTDVIPTGTGAVVFNASVADLTTPFSETEEFDISFGDCTAAACTVQLSSQIATPTPEPASMLLLASGLLGLGAAVRRRRRS